MEAKAGPELLHVDEKYENDTTVAYGDKEAKLSSSLQREPVLDGTTILVVEDDWVGRQIIETHLSKAGYKVISTAHSQNSG